MNGGLGCLYRKTQSTKKQDVPDAIALQDRHFTGNY